MYGVVPPDAVISIAPNDETQVPVMFRVYAKAFPFPKPLNVGVGVGLFVGVTVCDGV